jgi:hypothetical protein
LYPLPSLSPPTPLPKAKAAFSFAVNSSIQHLEPESAPKPSSEGEFGATTPVPLAPSIVTQIVIGCQRRLVVYSWRNGDPQDPKVCHFLILFSQAVHNHRRKRLSLIPPEPLHSLIRTLFAWLTLSLSKQCSLLRRLLPVTSP